MIDIVINYDKITQEFKVYEPSTDTLLITTSLGDSFIKLSEFLKSSGMIATDILGSQEITYHFDSATFLALIESNVNLLKRLNSAPSGFTISSQRFGQSPTAISSSISKRSTQNREKQPKKRNFSRGGGSFSKSAFNQSNRKFGSY